MNIALFTDTYYPEINGVATSVHQLKIGLESAGHNVYVFTTTNPDMQREDKEYRIKSVPFIFMKDRRFSFPIYYKWLKIVKKLNIDVIHTHTEFSLGILGLRIAKKLNIKHIHTYHTIYEEYIHYLKLPKNKYTVNFVKNSTKYFCNKAYEIIAPTEKTKNLLISYDVNTNITVVPTGIDLTKFENTDMEYIFKLRKKLDIQEKDVVLVSIGRLSKEKGTDEVILYFSKLLEKHKNIKLIIVGDGPHKYELKELVNRLKITDKVKFTGYICWDKIQNYYCLGDIFVSCSTSETQGLTYLEAVASGLYLLVRKDDSLDDTFINDGIGYQFCSYDEFSYFYEKLLLHIDKKLKNSVSDKYTQKGYTQSILNIYNKEEQSSD
ncbi:glycosyltransferase family 4 protein [Gemella sp. GH3]|uniref:glycosyltransferase family 4 protein n=1 Tax=unclassified Gemella TaxID=2624949 RepID=UPI0015D0244F|nr:MULTISPECIES: glycosyltransferase family 4 protein [unclassified Gemella]MBF0714142.1 glycosyltransferase family 4 protein [Gemella sp. GH3.1]NYS51094.1 glycosyltransferase family 4 protein [Gemella sp. GH3]